MMRGAAKGNFRVSDDDDRINTRACVAASNLIELFISRYYQRLLQTYITQYI